MQGPLVQAALGNKDHTSAPLPCVIRAAFGTKGLSLSLLKRMKQHSSPSIASSMNQAAGGSGKSKFGEEACSVTSCRSEDNIPESDVLKANLQEPSCADSPKFSKSTDTDEQPSPACSESNTFNRAPPFRNSAPVTPKIETLLQSDFDAPVFPRQPLL